MKDLGLAPTLSPSFRLAQTISSQTFSHINNPTKEQESNLILPEHDDDDE